MLMLHLPHYLECSPLVHAVSKTILVAICIAVFAMSKRVLVEFSCDGLSSHAGSNDALIVDESFNNWDNVGVLCSDIDY